jgi:hypothetical protein
MSRKREGWSSSDVSADSSFPRLYWSVR